MKSKLNIKNIWNTIKTAFVSSRVVRRFNKMILFNIARNYNELNYLDNILLRERSISGDMATKTYFYKRIELSISIIKFKIELLKCFKF